MADDILDSDFVIGVWASASRQTMRTLNGDGTETTSGDWIQVSRLGMPLTNEAVIPIGQKIIGILYLLTVKIQLTLNISSILN